MNLTNESAAAPAQNDPAGPASGSRRRRGWDGDGPQPEESHRPPSVQRGAELHQGEVDIDWVTLTLPREYLEDLTQYLEPILGPCNIGKGFSGYSEGRHFPFSMCIAYSHEQRPECCVKVPGSACQQLGSRAILEFITWVYDQGGHATRIDVRSDFKGKRLDLIDLAYAGCEDRQLCRCRCWEMREPRSNTGEYLGRCLTLGKRGKNGSGRFVRIYDKGLETGEATIHTWERWETEFTKSAADQVAQQLIESNDWKREALAFALGAVEFRDWTGSASLARRPLAPWWLAFLADVEPILVKTNRIGTDLDRWGGWFRRCVLPTFTTMAIEAGTDIHDVMDFFRNGKPIKRSDSPVVWEYLNALVDIEDHRREALKFPTGTGRFGFSKASPVGG